MYSDSISLAPALKPRERPNCARARGGTVGLGGGTILRTIFGRQPISRLKVGDILLDRRNHMVTICSIRSYHAAPSQIVRVEPTALGLGLAPGYLDAAILVGAGQKLGICDWRTQILFAAPTFSPAAQLVDGVNLHPGDSPTLLFDLRVEYDTIIFAGGMTTIIDGLA